MLNMFRAPLCPSSGAHEDSVGYHIGHLVLELLLVRSYVQVGWLSVRTEGCNTTCVTALGPDTHPSYLHVTPNQQQLKNQTAYVVTSAIVVSS